MSEKTTSITEAIQSGDKIPPSVYQMWIEDLMRDREILVDLAKGIRNHAQRVGLRGYYAQADEALTKVGELP